MHHEPLSPEEFARLVALPPDHPERLLAEQSPEFAARQRLLEAFESQAQDVAGSADAASAGRELVARLTRAAPMAPSTTRRHAWRTPRFAVAAAAALALAASSLWWAARPRPEPAVRGDAGASEFVLLAPVVVRDGVELRWTPATGADRYRILLHGADLREVARIEVEAGTRVVLRPASLPREIASGSELLAEVEAMRRGEPIGRTAAQRMFAP